MRKRSRSSLTPSEATMLRLGDGLRRENVLSGVFLSLFMKWMVSSNASGSRMNEGKRERDIKRERWRDGGRWRDGDRRGLAERR